MDTNTVEYRVTQIIAAQLRLTDEQVTPDKSIRDDLGADSLDVIEMVMEAEEEFELDISDDDAEKVNTVQDAIDLVNRLIA